MKRFICVQMGARRAYAVPAILERAGLLDRLYTDVCGNAGVGRVSSFLQAISGADSALGRLAGRKVPEAIRRKTHTFDAPAVRRLMRSVVSRHGPESAFREQLRFGREIGSAMIAKGFGEATHVYSMLSEGGKFLQEARRRGLSVVAESYCTLSTERILEQERTRFADWEPEVPSYSRIRRGFGVEEDLGAFADWFLCPSECVQDDLVENWRIARERTRLVPYGMNSAWLQLQPSPSPRRILFVGSANLNKGIHYLAMAAEKLERRGHRYEFRVAGGVTERVRGQAICRQLTFLNRVPRDRIQAEFQRADIFVLPSLAEGSAESTYEALAAGLPVVTTRTAGSVVRDGIEGRIVPERDPEALADAIEELVEDRALRDRMALAARARANDYTWERYGERLLDALRSIN